MATFVGPGSTFVGQVAATFVGQVVATFVGRYRLVPFSMPVPRSGPGRFAGDPASLGVALMGEPGLGAFTCTRASLGGGALPGLLFGLFRQRRV